MDLLQRVVTKAWTYFIIAGAVILIQLILKEEINDLINSSSSVAIPYLRLVQIGIIVIPLIPGIYLAIKNYEESR